MKHVDIHGKEWSLEEGKDNTISFNHLLHSCSLFFVTFLFYFRVKSLVKGEFEYSISVTKMKDSIRSLNNEDPMFLYNLQINLNSPKLLISRNTFNEELSKFKGEYFKELLVNRKCKKAVLSKEIFHKLFSSALRHLNEESVEDLISNFYEHIVKKF